MGNNTVQTVNEIEETREHLAQSVDELMGRAKVEAAAAGKKAAIVALALVGLFVIGAIAKRRVQV